MIVPPLAMPGLEFITDPVVREKIGITNRTLVFASKGETPRRVYNALRLLAKILELEFPSRMTSVALRHYVATLSQNLNLTPAQLDMLCRHMSHSVAVHLNNYRQTSGLVERVHIAKLMIVEDLQMAGTFAGKSLTDIKIEDVVMQAIQNDCNIDEVNTDDDEDRSDDDGSASASTSVTSVNGLKERFDRMSTISEVEDADGNEYEDEEDSKLVWDQSFKKKNS